MIDLADNQDILNEILAQDIDADGLCDYVEEVIMTDPYAADTDGDGVNDGDEDLDEDGLTNKEEITYFTNPLCADTDEDGLLDGEELNTYKTDPNKQEIGRAHV